MNRFTGEDMKPSDAARLGDYAYVADRPGPACVTTT